MNLNDNRLRYGLLALVILATLGISVGSWFVWPAWQLGRYTRMLERVTRVGDDTAKTAAAGLLRMDQKGLEQILSTAVDPHANADARTGAVRTLATIIRETSLYDSYFHYRGVWMSVRRWATEDGRERLVGLLSGLTLETQPALSQEGLDALYLFTLREAEIFRPRDRDRIAACASYVHTGSPQRDPPPEALLEDLRNTDAAVRFQALRAIRNYRYRDAAIETGVSALVRSGTGQVAGLGAEPAGRLAEGATAVKLEAARLLSDWGGLPVEEALTALLSDTNSAVQIAACEGLGRVGGARTQGRTGLRTTLPALIGRLEDVSLRVREAAGQALRRITDEGFGTEGSLWQNWWASQEISFDPIRARRRARSSTDPSVRAASLHYLGELGELIHAPEVMISLHDDASEVRAEAARALGKLESVQAVPELIGALEDPESAVRRAAAEALATITGLDFGMLTRRHHMVEEAPESSRGQIVRSWRGWWDANGQGRTPNRAQWLVDNLGTTSSEAKVRSLRALASADPDQRLLVERVLPVLDDRDPEVRWWALTALEHLGSSVHVEAAMRSLASPSETARNRMRAAEVALALGGDPAARKLAKLAASLEGNPTQDATFDAVIGALVERESKAGVDELGRLLESGSALEQKNALRAVGALSASTDSAGAGEGLVAAGLRKLVPRVFDFLSAKDQDQRFWAVQTLRVLTNEAPTQPYGYNFEDPDLAARERAADRWRRAYEARGGAPRRE